MTVRWIKETAAAAGGAASWLGLFGFQTKTGYISLFWDCANHASVHFLQNYSICLHLQSTLQVCNK